MKCIVQLGGVLTGGEEKTGEEFKLRPTRRMALLEGMAFSLSSCLHYADFFCKVRGSFDVTLSASSILNICCISIDRYYAVCHPLTYRSKINSGVVAIMIVIFFVAQRQAHSIHSTSCQSKKPGATGNED
ncbi:hypothetical protein Q8A73_018747 [Channa argus]|nr:hypothetical protein Q8A73_018747 [Channa argus]